MTTREVECKHERECAARAKIIPRQFAFLLNIIRDAFGAFQCTQRCDMYPPDHWSHRAQRVIKEQRQ